MSRDFLGNAKNFRLVGKCIHGFTRGNRFDGRDYFRCTGRGLWYGMLLAGEIGSVVRAKGGTSLDIT